MLKILCVKDVVGKAKDNGLRIMIGGDMNAHIWELDICENNNVKLLKNMVNEINLQILNVYGSILMGIHGSQRIVNLPWIISVLMIVH